MYNDIKRAMAHKIASFGLNVRTGNEGLDLWWGDLYSQGGGVAFNADICLPVFTDQLLADLKVHEAVVIKHLDDQGELDAKVMQDSRERYYHAGTMNVETESTTSELEGLADDEEIVAALDALHAKVKEATEKASNACFWLLRDLFMIEQSEAVEELWQRTTRNFRVTVLGIGGEGCSALTDGLSNGEPSEVLEVIEKIAAAPFQTYVARDLRIVIEKRINANEPDEDPEWEEIASEYHGAGIYETKDRFMSGLVREVLGETISQVREDYGIEKPERTKETVVETLPLAA